MTVFAPAADVRFSWTCAPYGLADVGWTVGATTAGGADIFAGDDAAEPVLDGLGVSGDKGSTVPPTTGWGLVDGLVAKDEETDRAVRAPEPLLQPTSASAAATPPISAPLTCM